MPPVTCGLQSWNRGGAKKGLDDWGMRLCLSCLMKLTKIIHSVLGAMLVAVLVSSCATSKPRAQTAIGAPVPQVSGLNQDGEVIDLHEACSGEWAVVFFYPRADTPG